MGVIERKTDKPIINHLMEIIICFMTQKIEDK